MSKAEILVSGATGRTGGAAIDELLKLGKRLRAYVRSDDGRAAGLRKRGVDIAVGNFTDVDDIRAAMEGIRSAYFLHPIAPGIISAAAYFAQAAKEAGVTAIVNMSQISARRESASHAAQDHWISERVFDWSGVATTHLRPTFFADWLVYPHFAKGDLGEEENRVSIRKRAACPDQHRRPGTGDRPYSGQSERP